MREKAAVINITKSRVMVILMTTMLEDTQMEEASLKTTVMGTMTDTVMVGAVPVPMVEMIVMDTVMVGADPVPMVEMIVIKIKKLTRPGVHTR